MALRIDIQKRLDGFALDVSLSAEAGVTALLGASGSGKSMTLRCIAGVEKPDAGYIELDGRVLFDAAKRIDLPPQKRRVGYLFQRYALFPNMTVWQNIETGLLHERDPHTRKRTLIGLIERFRLDGLESRFPREISGGQMQRVALCRMLAAKPEAILLDEPFAALDSHLRWQMERELRDALADFAGVMLLVSHDRGEVYRMSERVCVLANGKSEALTNTEALFKHPRTLSAALITGCKNCAPAVRIDAHTLHIPSWNATLACALEADESARFAGVRANHIRPCAADARQALPCDVEEAECDVFSIILTLRPEGAADTIRCELPKEAGAGYRAGDRAWFSFPIEAVMPLA